MAVLSCLLELVLKFFFSGDRLLLQALIREGRSFIRKKD